MSEQAIYAQAHSFTQSVAAKVKAEMVAENGPTEYLEIACPKCDGTYMKSCETAMTMDEEDDSRYPAYSGIDGINADGTLDFSGYTDYDELPDEPCYDSCETVTEDGHPKLRCGECQHEWFESRAKA